MCQLSDLLMLLCFTVDSKALDRYIHAVTICNSLALLVSQGSLKDFAVRIALLTTLQKCWLNGHSVLQLVCSCDGAIDFVSSVVLHGSSTSVVSGSRVDVTEDVNSFDIKSSEPCNDSSAGEAWLDCTVVSQSEYLNTFNGMEEKSVVAAHGSETVLFISVIDYTPCLEKNVPPLACYNFDTCERILIFF